jgi:hypothetical protein
LVGVNECRTESFGRERASGLVLGQAKAIVPSPEHIQQRVADVFRELPMHGSTVQIFVAGDGLPDAIIGGRRGPTPGVEFSQGCAVGIFAIRVSVINPTGPLHHFGRRAHDRHGRIARRCHLPEAVGIHAQPIEDGAHVHIGTQFSAGVVDVASLVGEDHRIVDTLLSAQEIVIDGHVHGAGR